METASLRQLPDRVISWLLVSLESRTFTLLLVGRVDSREPKGALPWTAWQARQRSSPSARSTGPLLPRVQRTENSYIRHRLATGSPSTTRTESRPGSTTTVRRWRVGQ